MNRNKWFYRTRQVGFLWKSALVLATVLVAIGAAVSLLRTHEASPVARLLYLGQEPGVPGSLGDAVDEADIAGLFNTAIHECLAGTRPLNEKLIDLRRIVKLAPEAEKLHVPVSENLENLSDDEYALASAFLRVSIEHEVDRMEFNETFESTAPFLELEGLAAKPVRYANFAMSFAYGSRNLERALEALHREIELYQEESMRVHLVNLCLVHERFDELEALQASPAYGPYVDSYVQQQIALSKMDWPWLIRTLIPAAYVRIDAGMVILALVSGLVWVTVILRFNGAITRRAVPVKLLVPALALGILSAHATILFIFWQENQLGLVLGDNILGQLAYCLGIGLREEGLKLLCFCPLIPFLRRRPDLEILTVAGLVGLGFAVEENINYFESTAGLSAVGRFVTANFLHISLTAMGGLALTRAVTHRRADDILYAVSTFGAIIVFHGLYDAFLIVDVLKEFGWFSSMTFILLSYQYFSWLRHLRDDWRDPVSATCLLTLGLVLVTGFSFGFFAWQVGVVSAFQAVAGEVLGVAVILILFYREIPETLDS